MGDRQDHILKVGYTAVCLAFGIQERPGGGKGPFSGRHHRPKSRPGSKASSWATRVNCTETQTPQGSKPLLPNNQKLWPFVHQCIAELEEREQLWIHFCYRDNCQKRGECWTQFLRKYTQEYIALHGQGAREETRAVIREMIAWRMGQEAGEIPWRAEFESINGTISRQNWHKTYKTHWKKICEDLAAVDRAALYKIGIKVSVH